MNSYELTEDVKTVLATMSERLNTPFEQLEGEFKAMFDSIGLPNPNEAEAQMMAVGQFRATRRGMMRGRHVRWVGYFIGDSGLRDWNAMKRTNGLQDYIRSPQNAIDNGLVGVVKNAQGLWYVETNRTTIQVGPECPDYAIEVPNSTTLIAPLETRPFFGNGPGARENDNFGKPLSKHQFERTFLFVGRRHDDESEPVQIWNVKATRDTAVSASVKLWEIGMFNMNPPSDRATTEKGKKTLYVNAAFANQQYGLDIEFDNPVDTLKALPNWTTLSGLESYLDTTNGREWCAVRAFVQDFNKTPKEGNSASITLDDPLYDTGVHDENPVVWLQDHLKKSAFLFNGDNGWAEYAVGSVIVIIGRPYRRQRKENGQVVPGEYFPATIEPWAVWAMPEYAVPAQTVTEPFTVEDFKSEAETSTTDSSDDGGSNESPAAEDSTEITETDE